MVGWTPRVGWILRISASSFLGPTVRDGSFVCQNLGGSHHILYHFSLFCGHETSHPLAIIG